MEVRLNAEVNQRALAIPQLFALPVYTTGDSIRSEGETLKKHTWEVSILFYRNTCSFRCPWILSFVTLSECMSTTHTHTYIYILVVLSAQGFWFSLSICGPKSNYTVYKHSRKKTDYYSRGLHKQTPPRICTLYFSHGKKMAKSTTNFTIQKPGSFKHISCTASTGWFVVWHNSIALYTSSIDT